MFKRKSNSQHETGGVTVPTRNYKRWLGISIIGYIVILVLVFIGSGAAVVINASNTDPNFCSTCHLMQSHVTSYLTGNHLDHVHEQAGVECKDCHDYDVPQEITAAVDYLTKNYTVDTSGELAKRDFGDEICTKCHVSMDHVALATDFLYRNPHAHADMGGLHCSQCHVSHAAQIDFCSECHDNGGQRMIEDTTPRTEVIGQKAAPPPSPW